MMMVGCLCFDTLICNVISSHRKTCARCGCLCWTRVFVVCIIACEPFAWMSAELTREWSARSMCWACTTWRALILCAELWLAAGNWIRRLKDTQHNTMCGAFGVLHFMYYVWVVHDLRCANELFARSRAPALKSKQKRFVAGVKLVEI